MAGSKSDRKINAKYDIFSTREGVNDSVRVGYIDTKRGYVSGLSVFQANKYAERNPGTQFIVTNRDKVKYININEVNKLTNKDILPNANPSGLMDEDLDQDPSCLVDARLVHQEKPRCPHVHPAIQIQERSYVP